MKYPAYPNYKDSGVQWLGRVPGHWGVKGLRYVCRLAYGDSLAAETREEGEVPVYGSNGQVGTHIHSNTKAPVIVVGRKGSFGKINFSNEPVFAIDTTYFIDGSCTKDSLPWLKYSLLPLRLDSASKDSAVPGLAREDAYESKLPVPPLPEQTAIAAFLDRETGRIDTLVAKKRRLIALLKEKRTALISRTVTRGLPADAAREFGLEPHTCFKDSGVEWLGQVPEGWDVIKVKYVAKMESGHTPSRAVPTNWVEEECIIPWVSLNDTKHLKEHDYISDTAIKISEEGMKNSSAHLLPAGAVVFTRDATIGLTAITTCEAAVSQHIIAWIPGKKIYAEYLLLAFKAMQQYLDSFTFGSTLKTIGMPDIRRLVAPVPPHSEQTAIATYLDRETAKLDKLVDKVEAAIARLQEYRTALITAAVTGKIDVRNPIMEDVA